MSEDSDNEEDYRHYELTSYKKEICKNIGQELEVNISDQVAKYIKQISASYIFDILDRVDMRDGNIITQKSIRDLFADSVSFDDQYLYMNTDSFTRGINRLLKHEVEITENAINDLQCAVEQYINSILMISKIIMKSRSNKKMMTVMDMKAAVKIYKQHGKYLS